MEKHYPEILRQFLGEERDRGFENYDRTTKEAADICGASQGTSAAAEGTEPFNRKERAEFSEQVRPLEEATLKEWALQHNLFISEEQFLAQYNERHIGAGGEQIVYLKEDGLTVVKVNKGRFHGNWLEYFNRLLFHAFLFPATKYTTVGFTKDEGSFAVITEQPFALLNQGASREIVENYLNGHGFKRVKNNDYCSRTISVKLEDLHDENVFLDEEGNILFIDPVIYFETIDLKLGGELIFHFPFN